MNPLAPWACPGFDTLANRGQCACKRKAETRGKPAALTGDRVYTCRTHQTRPLRACIARTPHYTLPIFFTAPGECRMTIYQQPPAPLPAPMPAPVSRSNGLGIAAFIVSL